MEQYSFTIGRFQPLHKGHIKLIRSVLDEGKKVVVALRDTGINDKNPYTIEERKEMFNKEFREEIYCGILKLIIIPDVSEVFYGRKVGWGIRQIKLDAKTEAISATEIRRKKKHGK